MDFGGHNSVHNTLNRIFLICLILCSPVFALIQSTSRREQFHGDENNPSPIGLLSHWDGSRQRKAMHCVFLSHFIFPAGRVIFL